MVLMIDSTSAFARTAVYDEKPPNGEETATANLAQREMAGRMLLTRRQLMERLENSHRPLFRGQVLQILDRDVLQLDKPFLLCCSRESREVRSLY